VIDSEALVRAAWSAVLEVPADAIDLDLDISSLGNSMHLIRVVLHLQEALGVELPLENLLDCASARDMVAVINTSMTSV